MRAMRCLDSWALVLTLVLWAGVGSPRAHAAPLRAADVPAALRPWIPWVLRGHETARCPTAPDEAGTALCRWAGPLSLTVNGQGGRFTQDWQVLARTFVPLPGDILHWPLDVKANNKSVPVIYRESVPVVELPAGSYRLTGAFQWTELPEALSIDSDIAIVALTANGRRIDFPRRTEDGDLFLQKEAAPAETDSLRVVVHRKLTDAVPLLLTTRLSLEVAGKARELTLGRALPDGFVAHALESQLPARIDPDGRLRLQVRPGTWTVALTGRRADADGGAGPVRFARPSPGGAWQDGDEVWVFEASPALRAASIEGVPAVDPRQTTLPPEWKALPAYLVGPQATLSLVQQRRGDADPAADQLTLERTLWLDFDGHGFTAQDSITGVFHRSWRLDMGPSQTLGRVVMGDADQFITRLPGGAAGSGVEIRQGRASIAATSRIEGAARAFPAVGWNHDFQSLAATLALPPGWRLVHASGADGVSSSWLRDWTLLDLFLVLISALAAAKLFGPRVGVVALLALGLCATEPEAPQWLWLAVLVAEALVRVLRASKVGLAAWLARLAVWIVLLLNLVPFAVHELRVGLFPAQGARAVAAGMAERRGSAYQQAPAAAQDKLATLRATAGHLRAAIGSDSSGGLNRDETSFAQKTSLAEASEAQMLRKARRSRDLVESGAGRAEAPAPPDVQGYDPSVVAQTGPGIPRWNWTSVALSWNGPVDQAQRLSLWLLSPLALLVLAFVRVGLLVALLLCLLWPARGAAAGLLGIGAAAAVLVVALSLASRPVQAAEFPPEPLLNQLREQLLEKPACGTSCASLGRLMLEATPDRLRLRCEISAAAPAAVALPGGREQWTPALVLVDGKAGAALWGDEDGTLWVQVPPGSHQVVMEGPLPARDTVQLALPTRPHLVVPLLRGWRLGGLGEDGAIDETLQLSRLADAGARPAGAVTAGTLAASSLPAFVTVERTLRLGLKWQVETVVRRATPTGAAALIDVPLLAGESPLGEGLRVSHGHAQVSLGPDEQQTSWTSVLEQRQTLQLQAARAPAFSEVWRLDLGPLWHADVAGIPPILQEGAQAGAREWRPWPGETVSLRITRPPGSDGQTLTIETVDLTFQPGARQSAVEARLMVRASRGGQQVATLPSGATLLGLVIDGVSQPLRQDGDRVTFPLHPGTQTVTLSYRDPAGLGALHTPRVPDLGAPSTNVRLSIQMPDDRWVLLMGGPRLGPSALFWSTLLVLLLIALALGRSPLTPLRAHHWVLLGLGLSQIPIPGAALCAGFFLTLGLRRRWIVEHRWLFDLQQLALAAWAVLAVALLFVAVRQGLLSAPDMDIAGNGSDVTHLHWYSDRAGTRPDTAWVLSAPLLVYRLAMLAWALWLALALIGWARWAWACFSAGGLWRPLRKPKLSAG